MRDEGRCDFLRRLSEPARAGRRRIFDKTFAAGRIRRCATGEALHASAGCHYMIDATIPAIRKLMRMRRMYNQLRGDWRRHLF